MVLENIKKIIGVLGTLFVKKDFFLKDLKYFQINKLFPVCILIYNHITEKEKRYYSYV